jgi:D-serine deaminase-like pyridoxal phosphate-dependent protein
MPPLTPALVVDPEALDANIAAMQALADDAGLALRPHAKGHRSPWIAHRQLAAGAAGIAVASVDEAATLVAAGVTDVLVTTVLPRERAPQVAELARGARIRVVVDAVDAARALDDAARSAGITLGVLVDVDVGQRRSAIATPEQARRLAEEIGMTCTALTLDGVQGYDGHLQGLRDAGEREAGHAQAMARLGGAAAPVADLVRRLGRSIVPLMVTTAGTATTPLACAVARRYGITEVQPGSYALMDDAYAAKPGVGFRQAAFVLTTVLSRLSASEVIVDAGARAVSTDLGPARVLGRDDVTWESAGDEHGRLRGPIADLFPGDRVRLVPSHTDTTVVLHRPVVADGPEAWPPHGPAGVEDELEEVEKLHREAGPA